MLDIESFRYFPSGGQFQAEYKTKFQQKRLWKMIIRPRQNVIGLFTVTRLPCEKMPLFDGQFLNYIYNYYRFNKPQIISKRNKKFISKFQIIFVSEIKVRIYIKNRINFKSVLFLISHVRVFLLQKPIKLDFHVRYFCALNRI